MLSILLKTFFSERRNGKDRRRYIDPRFRNPDYAQYIDRRAYDRRRPEYDDAGVLVQEHISKKNATVLGIVMAVFLLWFTLLAGAGVDTTPDGKKVGILYTHRILPVMFIHE